jgi:hypothetical protein
MGVCDRSRERLLDLPYQRPTDDGKPRVCGRSLRKALDPPYGGKAPAVLHESKGFINNLQKSCIVAS